MLTVVFLLVAPSPAAHAADPPVLSAKGQITDQVNALGDRRGAVARAIDALYEKRHIQLFVVYVKDFSGRTAQDRARATASRNGLGQDDILLAIGTQARQYAYTGQSGTTKFTNAQLEAVARKAIDPPLAQHDWAGTAIGAANGYSAIVAGQPVPTPAITPGASDPGGHSTVGMGNGALLVPLALVVVVGGLAIYAYTRRRRRAETRPPPRAAHSSRAGAVPGGSRWRSWTRRPGNCWPGRTTRSGRVRRNSAWPSPGSGTGRRSRTRRR